MKRAVIFLLIALIALLTVFPITVAAQTTAEPVRERNEYHFDTARTNDYVSFDYTGLYTEKDVLDLAAAEVTVDDGEVEEDGINTKVASVWIIGISAVFIAAILSCVILFARKNKEQK